MEIKIAEINAPLLSGGNYGTLAKIIATQINEIFLKFALI